MGVYTHSSGNWFSRRGTFVAILIAFHLVLLWALKSGFAVKFVQSITQPIKAEIINEVKIEEPPPPPPTVRIELPPVQVPPILVDIPIPQDPPPTVIIAETTTETVPPGPPTPPAPPAPPARNVTSAGYSFRPNTDDYYPSASRSLQEEGSTRIRLCYDERGRPDTVDVDEGSGFSRLDEAAIRYGKAVRIRPGTEEGKAVKGCVRFSVKFSLKNER